MESVVRSLASRQAGGPEKAPLRFLSSCSSFVSRLSDAAVLEGHAGCVNSIHWNGDGSLLLTGSDDCCVNIWSGNTYKLISRIRTGHVRNIFSARLVPCSSDKQIVSTGMDGQVRFIDIGGGEVRTAPLDSNDHMVYKITFMPNQPYVFLTTQQDSTVRLHDLRARGTPQILLDMRALNLGEYGVNTIAFDPLGTSRFVLGCSDPYLRIFDVRKPTTHTVAFCPSDLAARVSRPGGGGWFSPGFYITGVDWSTKGELAATYSRDHVYTFDASRPPDTEGNIGPICSTFSQKFLGSRNVRTFLKEVAFLAGDQYVASGSDCGHLYIWSRVDGTLVQCIRADAHVVNGVAPHPYLLKVASCGIDSEGKVWDVGPTVTFDENKRKAAVERGASAGAGAADSDSEGGEVITLNQLLQLLRRSAGRPGAPRVGNIAQLLRMMRGGDDENDNSEEGEEQEQEEEEEEGEEQEGGEGRDAMEDTTAPRMTMEQVTNELDEVEKEKDRGNEFFRNSDWCQARECYNVALARLANVPPPPSGARMLHNRYNGLRLTSLMNRAAAAVKANAADQAIEDCNLALQIDPENAKAVYRRGCAYLLVGRFEEAEADATEALRLLPGNAEVRRLLLAARGRRAGQL